MRYQEQIIAASMTALGGVVSNLQPARLAVHEILCPGEGLVAEPRPPYVLDSHIPPVSFSPVLLNAGGKRLGITLGVCMPVKREANRTLQWQVQLTFLNSPTCVLKLDGADLML